jgi:ABC-2 type transport system permease protein
MRTFKAYFRKEIIESIRQYRYIIIASGIILFAILDPIMLKLLPSILKGKVPEGAMQYFTQTGRMMEMQSYIKDLSQIGFIVLVLGLMNILSDELSSQRLVFPYSKGYSSTGMITAKFVHYSLTIIILVFIGFFINYIYSVILFTGQDVLISGVIAAAVMVSLYYIFNIMLLIFLGTIFKRGIASAAITLAFGILSSGLLVVKSIENYVPYRLIPSANTFSLENSLLNIAMVSLYTVILWSITVIRMKRVEVI